MLGGDPCESVAHTFDLFLGKLHFQSQRVGGTVGEVRETGQHVDVDDFWFREVLAQYRKMAL